MCHFYMKRILFQLATISMLSVVFSYCTADSNKSKSKSKIDSSSSKLIGNQTGNLPNKLDTSTLGIMFFNNQPFEIISLKKGVTLVFTGPDDTSACKDWSIPKKDLYSIIKNSESIEGTTWDLGFAFTTCIIDGQIKQAGQLFNYSINAGSWFSIECRDTSLLFGNYKKTDRKYFLKSPSE